MYYKLLFGLAAVVLTLWPCHSRAAAWEVWDDCELETGKYFDGDSFHIRHGTDSEIIRLYFVDAPEADGAYGTRIAEQAAYFHTTPPAVLEGGQAAKDFTKQFLAGKCRVITSRKIAPGASKSDRLYGIVQSGGRSLDEALVQAGLARLNGELASYPDEDAGRDHLQRLRTLEESATKERRGLWAAKGTRLDRFKRLLEQITPLFSAPAPAKATINVNTATKAELEKLPGIGPKTAERIIAARPLKTIRDLDAIPGIGPKKIEALWDQVSF